MTKHSTRERLLEIKSSFFALARVASSSPSHDMRFAAAARIAGRPVDRSIAPIVDFIDAPPAVPLTAVDRDKHLPLEFPTLNSQAARRLDQLTRELLASRDQPAEREAGNTNPGS